MFRYTFKYEYKKNTTLSHNIIIVNELTDDEYELLRQILSNFPHCIDDDWLEKFLQLDCDLYNKYLMNIAANAYDEYGNTVLGVACETWRVH